MIVVVLSICPAKLRGELTRWLVEISTGVYVGHVPARVRELLWLRIIEDVGRGRALMVHSTRGEQRLAFRVHNHAWEVVDHDGLSLMRRTTAESREIADRARKRRAKRAAEPEADGARHEQRGTEFGDLDAHAEDPDPHKGPRNWSNAARRRRFKNSVERRHDSL